MKLAEAAVGPEPPELVTRPWQLHRWSSLSFLHWPAPLAVLQAMLPDGLEVDRFDGDAWVGLVPFHLDITVPGVPYLPWIGRFVETNVRTYVRAADGTRGIWFLSLDAQRLGAAVLARAAWTLPYKWSRMRLTRTDNLITYECRRRLPGTDHPTSSAVVEIGDAYRADELEPIDHFLTARWTLFSMRGRTLTRTQAHHGAWPLRHATVHEIDDHLLRAAGLPTPLGRPRVLYSDGVDVRLGARHRVER